MPRAAFENEFRPYSNKGNLFSRAVKVFVRKLSSGAYALAHPSYAATLPIKHTLKIEKREVQCLCH
ncbi:MAG: hypothetical protein JWM44_1708 [Bacilli bacterium]|jgi:hypothetical protein|nr:hypothetical protein [Bacilli bacterium]